MIVHTGFIMGLPWALNMLVLVGVGTAISGTAGMVVAFKCQS
jgi:hypothetical protein